MNRDRLHFMKSKKEVIDHAKRFWGHDEIVLTKEDIDKMRDGHFIDGTKKCCVHKEG